MNKVLFLLNMIFSYLFLTNLNHGHFQEYIKRNMHLSYTYCTSPAFTNNQSAHMWQETLPLLRLCPTVWFFIFPLWTLLLFACKLSRRGVGRSQLLTHYLFST